MDDVIAVIKKQGIIPIGVFDSLEVAVRDIGILVRCGIRCVEIAFRNDKAGDVIRGLSEKYPDLLIGAGTILSENQLDAALDSGAGFIVTPCVEEDVIKKCRDRGIPVFPGAMTPTEISRCISLGIRIIKIFPVEICGGVGYLDSLSGVFGDAEFIPTGGINEDNIGNYLSRRNVVACGGTWLLKDDIQGVSLEDRIIRMQRLVNECR